MPPSASAKTGELAERWLLAQNDLTKLIAFINTVLGETWADRSRDIKAKRAAWPAPAHTTCARFRQGASGSSRPASTCRDDRLRSRSPAGAGMIAVGHSTTTSCPVARATTSVDAAGGIPQRRRISKTSAAKPCASKPPASTPAATTPTWSTLRAQRRHQTRHRLQGTPARWAGSSSGKPGKQDVNLRGQTLKTRRIAVSGRHRHRQGTAQWQTARRHRQAGRRTQSAFQPSAGKRAYDQLVSETYNPRKQRWELKRASATKRWIPAIAIAGCQPPPRALSAQMENRLGPPRSHARARPVH